MFRLSVVLSFLCLVSASIIPGDDDRIVGGTTTTIAAHPYQVSFQYDKSHFCGGSLHSKTVVVTAAHCVKAVQSVDLSSLQIRLGSTDWSSGGVVRGVQKMKIHPSFDPNTMQYDVALVKLASAVSYSDTIQNITLAVNEPANDAPGVISGWGTLKSGATTLPTVLRAADVDIITRSYCSSSAYQYSTNIKSTMICAGADGKDSCQGDSGGPLVNKNTGRLVGIVSWGNGCAKAGYPGVYSDVPALRDWIINNAPTL